MRADVNGAFDGVCLHLFGHVCFLDDGFFVRHVAFVLKRERCKDARESTQDRMTWESRQTATLNGSLMSAFIS